jgi:hypothetical protein
VYNIATFFKPALVFGGQDTITSLTVAYQKDEFTNQTQLAEGSLTTTYLRDGFGRLSRLTQAGPGFNKRFTYTYDNNDNIVSRDDGTTADAFTYDMLDRILTNSEGDVRCPGEPIDDGIQRIRAEPGYGRLYV